jgi:hypothetical protein
MGYKILGYLVWHGGRWYARRRLHGAQRKLATVGLAAAIIGGLVVAQRHSAAHH